MTPLASDLRSAGTISGISATTGPLTACLKILRQNMVATRKASDSSAENGTMAKKTAVSGSSVIIYGILLPMGVLVLSESAENTGMRKTARMLSSVITVPTTAEDSI